DPSTLLGDYAFPDGRPPPPLWRATASTVEPGVAPAERPETGYDPEPPPRVPRGSHGTRGLPEGTAPEDYGSGGENTTMTRRSSLMWWKRCGVRAGTYTTLPRATVVVSSPTVIAAR